jgi:hypothetical protein
MNFKKTATVFITMLCVSVTFSQNINISQGQEFTPENDAKFNYYVGNDTSGVYIRRTRTKGKGTSYFIQKLNPSKNMSVVYSKDLDIDIENKETIYGSFLKGSKIMVFTELYNKDEQLKYLLLREFSASDGSKIGETHKAASLSSDPWGVSGRNFYVSFSPDNSKMAITSEFQWPKKTPEVKTDLYETATLKKTGSKQLLTSYGNSTISSSSYKIGNDGTFFYLFYYMIDFEEEVGGFAFASIQPNASKTIVTELPFTNIEIKNGDIEFIGDKIVFSGMFKDIVTKKQKKEGKIKKVGFYSFFINPKTNEIINKGFDYFPADVAAKMTYKDGLIEESPADKFYSFENIFTLNDNIYLMESHSYAISSSNGASISFERELIVSKFNKSGKLEWMRVIPKFTGGRLNDFNFMVKNNQVYLFYAEHPKNLEKGTVTDYNAKKYSPIRTYNGSLLVCTTFDEAGNINRKEVFRNEGWCYDPVPTNILLDKDNGLLLRMINKDKERYDKLIIN